MSSDLSILNIIKKKYLFNPKLYIHITLFTLFNPKLYIHITLFTLNLQKKNERYARSNHHI